MNALVAGPARPVRQAVKYHDTYPHWHYPAEFVLKPSPFSSGSAVESAHVVRRHHAQGPLHSRSRSGSAGTPTPTTPTSAASAAATSTAHAVRASGSRAADPVRDGVTADSSPAPAAPAGGAASDPVSDPDTVAFYLSAPSSGQGAARRLLDAFRPRAPVYLTSFVYEDEDPVAATPESPPPSTSTPTATSTSPHAALAPPQASAPTAASAAAPSSPPGAAPPPAPTQVRLQRCTRSELCEAFGRLVRDWHRFWSFGMDVLYHVPSTAPAGREAEFEARFGETLARLRGEWKATQYRLFWGTYLFGDYLEALSALEDAGRLPGRWPRTGLDTSARAVRFPGVSLSHRAPGGCIDDYAFRAARTVNTKELDGIPEVEDAYTDIEGVMWDMLMFLGHDLERGIEALPKMQGAQYETPGRFEPPPPPYAPPSYDAACESSSGCSSGASSGESSGESIAESSGESTRASSGWGSPRSSYDASSE